MNIRDQMIKKLIVGWREWISLPELNIEKIKVKIDSGAKTSAIHAENIKIFEKNNIRYVKFDIYPIQKNNQIKKSSICKIHDIRDIKSSNGQSEERIIIQTQLVIGSYSKLIEISLTDRDIMKFRMLLGREAMSDLLINPSMSYIT